MAKVSIIRQGATRSVSVLPRLADALVKTGKFSYAEDTQVSQPKRKAKRKDAGSGDAPVILNKTTGNPVEEEGPQIHPPKQGPMTSARLVVKPTSRVGVPLTSREQLEAMTKAELKVYGTKLGVDLKPSEPKDEWVRKFNRYLRRDMRAVR